MKITDLIPGTQMTDERFNIISRKIMLAVNPEGLSVLELWSKLILISKEEMICRVRNNICDEYYILYTHPCGAKSNKLFFCKKDEVMGFIKDNFDQEHEDGMDVIIADALYNRVFIGNHDGMLLIFPE